MADRNPDVVKKRYGILKGKIQGPGKEYLDSDIDSDAHLRKIANLMDKWTVRPDLLGLKINPDVQGILQNKHLYPTNEDQRKRAVLLWKERTGTPTYNALLLICVKGEMDDAAKEIVRILNEEPPMLLWSILEVGIGPFYTTSFPLHFYQISKFYLLLAEAGKGTKCKPRTPIILAPCTFISTPIECIRQLSALASKGQLYSKFS